MTFAEASVLVVVVVAAAVEVVLPTAATAAAAAVKCLQRPQFVSLQVLLLVLIVERVILLLEVKLCRGGEVLARRVGDTALLLERRSC